MVSEDDHGRMSGKTDCTDGYPANREATRFRRSGAENDSGTESPHTGAAVGRRGVLTGITGVAAGSLAVGSANAFDHGSGVPEPPIAEYDARSCDLEGQTFRFGEETLEELYGSTDDYVAAFGDAVDDAVERGHLLPADAASLQERAASVSIGSGQSVWFGVN